MADEGENTDNEDVFVRNSNGKLNITLCDESSSEIGDEINYRHYILFYDSNNDDIFDDTEIIDERDGDGSSFNYELDNVGKYKIVLNVKETFTDTIPSLIDDSVYLSGNTEKVFEITNQAPKSKVTVEKSKIADIIFTVGSADKDVLNAYSEASKLVEDKLKEKGIEANITTVSTSAITATDTFAWKEYDHPGFNDWGHVLPQHIQYTGKDIKMVGYYYAAFKDFLYVEDNNPDRKVFDFDFYNLFPQLFKLFILLMLIGIVVFILSKLIYERLFQLGLLFTFWIFICTYVQGSFLSGNLPAMDGTTIDWSAFKADSIISVVVWLIIGLAITLLTRFFHMEGMKKIIKFSSIFITAILFVTLVVVSINQNGLARKNNVVATSDKEFTYSNDKNFIVLVLDMVDSQTFREILEEKNGEWESVLEDFTYYPNTTCAYPYTKHAIPHLLTNEWYLNEGDLDEFTLDAMKTSPLFETLEGNDYKMGLYEAYVKYDQECVDRFENIAVLPYEFSSFKDVIKKELKLVWFKYAPYPLKKFVNIKVDDFNNIRKANEEIKPFEYFNDTFYDSINNEEIVKIDDKCFKFIHIEGAHMPFRFDENVNPISEEEGTYELMMKCSMTITKAYLEKLKEAGVYDNSGIIIMTDHGYQNGREPRVLSRSNGFLVVKGINEQHEMYIDEAPISYEDIHEAFQRVIAGKQGDEVFDAKTGDSRKRRYIWYNGPTDYDHMVEYIQTGYASDTSTMIETGNYYDYSE